MPYSKLNLGEAADFLHISEEDLRYLAEKGDVPCFHEKGKLTFRKHQIKDWASESLLKEKQKKLGKKHYTAKQIWSRSEEEGKSLTDYIKLDALDPFLGARTKSSLLRELVNLASRTNLVHNGPLLHQLLIDREETASTGLEDGVAVPHPRIHPPSLFAEPFLAVAYIPGGIPFGAMDGKLSDLFFLPCACTDQEHIFMLSRLATLLRRTPLSQSLRQSESPQDMWDRIEKAETNWQEEQTSKALNKKERS